MPTDLRPSRLWGHLLKYYILAILSFSPFILNFLRQSQHRFAITFINYVKGTGVISVLSLLPSGLTPYLPQLLFAFGILFILIAEIKRLRLKYILFDDGVVKKVGFITTEIKNVSYNQTDSIYTNRSILEKIAGTGDLVIETPGNTESLILEGVSSPKEHTSFMINKAGGMQD